MKTILLNGFVKKSNIIEVDSTLPFFNYGQGFFETILYYNNRLYRFNNHIKRLNKSIEIFNYKVDLKSISEKLIIQAIESNPELSNAPCLKIKIIAAPIENEDIWSTVVLAGEFKFRQNQIFAVVDNQISNGLLNKHKSVNYFSNIATLNHYKKTIECLDEVLLINKKKRIIEGTYSNVICLHNGNIYIVNSKEPYLQGVTQGYIVDNYNKIGLKKVCLKRKGFSEDFLKKCDEIIITSSLSLVARIYKIKLSNGKYIYKPKNIWAEKIKKFLLE